MGKNSSEQGHKILGHACDTLAIQRLRDRQMHVVPCDRTAAHKNTKADALWAPAFTRLTCRLTVAGHSIDDQNLTPVRQLFCERDTDFVHGLDRSDASEVTGKVRAVVGAAR